MKLGPMLSRYCEIRGIHDPAGQQEILDWFNGYINRPGEFPALIAAGLVEDTKEARREAIQSYVKSEIDASCTGAILRAIEADPEGFEERAAVREFDGRQPREQAELEAAIEVNRRTKWK